MVVTVCLCMLYIAGCCQQAICQIQCSSEQYWEDSFLCGKGS